MHMLFCVRVLYAHAPSHTCPAGQRATHHHPPRVATEGARARAPECCRRRAPRAPPTIVAHTRARACAFVYCVQQAASPENGFHSLARWPATARTSAVASAARSRVYRRTGGRGRARAWIEGRLMVRRQGAWQRSRTPGAKAGSTEALEQLPTETTSAALEVRPEPAATHSVPSLRVVPLHLAPR